MTARNRFAARAALSTLLSAGGVYSLCALLEWGRAENHRFWLLGLFALAAVMGYRLFSSGDGRMRRYGLVFGLLFGLCQLMGWRLDALGTMGAPGMWALCLLCACCFAPALGGGFAALVRLVKRGTAQSGGASQPRHSNRAVTLFYACVVFLCWVPVFLAYYPGIFGYDVLAQIPQVQLGQYSAHHPLVHTLLMGGFYALGGALGSCTAGIAAYTLFQMAAMALCDAYALLTLYRARCPRWVRVTALLVFSLAPFHSMLAVACTKDTLFSGMLLVLCTLLFQGWREPTLWKKRSYLLRVALAVFGACVLRNNGLPALAASVLLLCWFWRDRAVRRRFAAAFAAGILLAAGVNAGLKAGLHASGVNTRESLSVPINQVGRVIYLYPELREDADVQALWTRPEVYEPMLADPAKRFSNVGMSTLKQFASLWWRYLKAYPTEYVDSFLLLTKGYWQLDDVSHAAVYSEELEQREGYLHSAFREDLGVEKRSLFPSLEALYERLFSANEYQRVPLLSALCAPAFWAWALWLLLFIALYLRRKAVWMAGGMLFPLFLTLLMGPCCLVRYVYPIMLCAPALLGMLLSPQPAAEGDGAALHA